MGLPWWGWWWRSEVPGKGVCVVLQMPRVWWGRCRRWKARRELGGWRWWVRDTVCPMGIEPVGMKVCRSREDGEAGAWRRAAAAAPRGVRARDARNGAYNSAQWQRCACVRVQCAQQGKRAANMVNGAAQQLFAAATARAPCPAVYPKQVRRQAKGSAANVCHARCRGERTVHRRASFTRRISPVAEWRRPLYMREEFRNAAEQVVLMSAVPVRSPCACRVPGWNGNPESSQNGN